LAWKQRPFTVGRPFSDRRRIICRNIKPLYNFNPPADDADIRAAAVQFVRKVSGYNKPSKVNEAAFLTAVDEIAAATHNLLNALATNAPPRDRAVAAARAQARSARRFDKEPKPAGAERG
jgi:hypothetical protein